MLDALYCGQLDICLILLFQELNMPSKYTKFQNLVPFKPLFEIKLQLQSVTHKDDHFAKNYIKNWMKNKSSNYEIQLLLTPFGGVYVRNCNR